MKKITDGAGHDHHPRIVTPAWADRDPRIVTRRYQAARSRPKTRSNVSGGNAEIGGTRDSRTSFGGGIGEDQFSSFLRDAQSTELAKSGGIGLAESLFNAMKRSIDA
jgi:peptidoglycan hydrolase FlgJ